MTISIENALLQNNLFLIFKIQVHMYLPLHGTQLSELNFDLTCQSSSLTPHGVYLFELQGH